MKALKSLIVEDSNDDVELLLRHLASEGYAVQATVVQTPAAMKAALAAEAGWTLFFPIIRCRTLPAWTRFRY